MKTAEEMALEIERSFEGIVKFTAVQALHLKVSITEALKSYAAQEIRASFKGKLIPVDRSALVGFRTAAFNVAENSKGIALSLVLPDEYPRDLLLKSQKQALDEFSKAITILDMVFK